MADMRQEKNLTRSNSYGKVCSNRPDFKKTTSIT